MLRPTQRLTMLRPALLRPTLRIPFILPRPSHPLRSFSRLPPSPRIRSPPPVREPIPEEPESPREIPSPEVSPRSGRPLLVLFLLLSAPITILYHFPNAVLPPCPDPPALLHLSKSPLTLPSWIFQPYTNLQLFVFRLRRGEYSRFLRTNFSYIPHNFVSPTPDFPWRWWTWATYMFAHGGLLHYVFCAVAMSSIIPVLASRFGTLRTASVFLGGGVGAAGLESAYEMLRHGDRVKGGKTAGLAVTTEIVTVTDAAGRSRERMVRRPVPEPGLEGMFSPHIGSSGGLMAMFLVSAWTMPQLKWTLMFIPYGIPSRVLMGALLTWDVAGAMGWDLVGKGIGHMGHLGGDVMGVLLYALWLRRLPVSRYLTVVRKAQGFKV